MTTDDKFEHTGLRCKEPEPYDYLCKILGHAWHPDAAEFYCVYDCQRCGHQGSGDEWNLRERIVLRLYWWRYEAGLRWTCMREWWKCSECGGRFGKHNYDEFEHIPF